MNKTVRDGNSTKTKTKNKPNLTMNLANLASGCISRGTMILPAI